LIAALFLTASVGVGVQSNPLCVEAPPGAVTPAGPLYVTDTGTEAETVTAGTIPVGTEAQPLSRGQRLMPASWVAVSYPRKWLVVPQSSVHLASGGNVNLPVSVSVPAGAPAGTYVINVWAHTTSGPSGGGISVSAGAGAAAVLIAGVGEPPSCATTEPQGPAIPASQYVPAAGPAQASPAGDLSGTDLLAVIACAFIVLSALTPKRRG
jgi:hypothetical protein